MTITIELPWPHKDLSPNARVHHMALHRAKKKARGDAMVLTQDAVRKSGAKFAPPVPVKFTLSPPDRRLRDTDNIIASMKAIQDGVADGLGIDDRHFVPVYEIAEPVKFGRVTVTISPAISTRKDAA